MSLIRCDVQQCVYHQHGFCHAGSIRVRPNNTRYVEDQDHTACATFLSSDDPVKSTLDNFEDNSIAGGDEFVEFVQDANSIFSH